MDKFIEFNDCVFNTRHIIALETCKRNNAPKYGISMYATGDVERYQWFNEEYVRDSVFYQLSRKLLNDF